MTTPGGKWRCWPAAQLIPRLPLTARQRHAAAAVFQAYLGDRGAIVRTFAMQALADLAVVDTGLRPRIAAQLRRLTATGTPAMRARGRRLLAALRDALPKA